MVSLAVVIAGLTWATLFIVRRTAEERVQREIQEESQNAMKTFQVLQQGHVVALMHKADLLASLVTLRNGDPSGDRRRGKGPLAIGRIRFAGARGRERENCGAAHDDG